MKRKQQKSATPRKPKSSPEDLPVCAVLLAGGRGTRFWPRSRTRTPKQLLNIAGRETMLRETMTRLSSLVSPKNMWAVTNVEQAAGVRREMRRVPASHILAEPIGRNTAAAIGLAAIHLAHAHGDALMAVLPSDSFVADAKAYVQRIRAAFSIAGSPGNLVVVGVPPTRPETGYGYIERGDVAGQFAQAAAYQVRRFTEKPTADVAQEYLSSGKYFWNAGIFVWRVSTLLSLLQQFLPATHRLLLQLQETIGTQRYAGALRRIYPKLESISVDYAIMEPATRPESSAKVFVIPAEVGWSDIGSWAAVHELHAGGPQSNVSSGPSFTLDATGNYFWSPKKFVAAIGVRDLVLVETDDAILICSREKSQDVGKIVKWLEEHKKFGLI
jgi:mannose-1-phosphate guanylyltransferase